MKRQLWRMVLLGLLAGAGMVGCESPRKAVVVTPSGQIMVPDKPRAPRNQLVTSRPSDSYVWVDGAWTFVDDRWVWVPGHWLPPGDVTTWVEGHWDQTAGGSTWVPGHWQQASVP